MKIKLLILVSTILLLSSWNKDLSPYSIFKKSKYEKIQESGILVDLNSSYSIVIQTGYELILII